jgi:hypothetical protein
MMWAYGSMSSSIVTLLRHAGTQVVARLAHPSIVARNVLRVSPLSIICLGLDLRGLHFPAAILMNCPRSTASDIDFYPPSYPNVVTCAPTSYAPGLASQPADV